MKIILLLFLVVFSYSFKIEAEYVAKYGWFGTIAKAKGVYEKNKTNYQIKTFTKSTGFAKTIANIKQYYISKGVIKNNILIPKIYKNIIIRNGKKYELVYSFDYNNSKIYKTKYKEGKFIYKKTLPFFAKNDILTLYWNLPKIMKTKKKTFTALGGDKLTGRVDVEIIKQTTSQTYLRVNLYNKVFAGDKGILYLYINNSNWITTKGMVKNVLKIGDLKGEIVNLKISP